MRPGVRRIDELTRRLALKSVMTQSRGELSPEARQNRRSGSGDGRGRCAGRATPPTRQARGASRQRRCSGFWTMSWCGCGRRPRARGWTCARHRASATHDLGQNARRIRRFLADLDLALQPVPGRPLFRRARRGDPSAPRIRRRRRVDRVRSAARPPSRACARPDLRDARASTARPRRQPRIEAAIDARDDLRDRAVAAPQALEDRALAHLPVGAQRPHIARGRSRSRRHAPAGRCLRAVEQAVERGHVVGHRAVRRRDHGRRPAHHMIAGEEDVRAGEREGEMVRRVPGRRDRLQPVVRRPRRSPPSASSRSGAKLCGLRRRRAESSPVCAALRRAAAARTARRSAPAARNAPRMIAMRMRDEDCATRASPIARISASTCADRPGRGRGRQDRLADQKRVGAVKGERAGICGGHAADAGRDLDRLAVARLEVAVEHRAPSAFRLLAGEGG